MQHALYKRPLSAPPPLLALAHPKAADKRPSLLLLLRLLDLCRLALALDADAVLVHERAAEVGRVEEEGDGAACRVGSEPGAREGRDGGWGVA